MGSVCKFLWLSNQLNCRLLSIGEKLCEDVRATGSIYYNLINNNNTLSGTDIILCLKNDLIAFLVLVIAIMQFWSHGIIALLVSCVLCKLRVLIIN